jgi:spore coat protein U-like protein
MNRILIAAAAAALAVLAGTPAQANTSGTIQLKGSVAKACTIGVEDMGTSLNLVNGENAKAVGRVVENCNSSAGYDITITSTNAGKLKSGNDLVAYSLVYDNQVQTLNSAWTLNRNAAQFDKQVTVGVTVPANNRAVAGNYTDTITIQIAAK